MLSFALGQQVDDAVNKDEATKRAKAIDTSGNSNIPSSCLSMDLNFPLPNEQGPACLVHLYDQESTFKVNEMIEFIGILSVDPGLAVFDQHMAFKLKKSTTTKTEQFKTEVSRAFAFSNMKTNQIFCRFNLSEEN